MKLWRCIFIACTFTVLGAGLAECQTQTPASAPIRAQDFLEGIGTQTHLRYRDTSYANIDAIIAALKYLGMPVVRDSPPEASEESEDRFAQLARAGVRFNFEVRGDIPATIARIDDFVHAYPQSVVSIEGPNEVNHWPVSYNGVGGLAGGAAYQAALYDAVKADGNIASLPVYALDDFPAAQDKVDFGNAHTYPFHGDQPFETIESHFDKEKALFPEKPVVFTESGYCTLLGHYGGWGCVDNETQAVLTLNMLLDAFSLGVHRVFLYELLDEHTRTHSTAGGDYFGLFDAHGDPKPVATLLHNLSFILADSGPQGRSFKAQPIFFTVAGLTEEGRALLIEKSDGTAVIALWREPDIWNAQAEAPVAVRPISVTLHFNAARAFAAVEDPLLSISSQRAFARVQTLNVSLGAHALFVTVGKVAVQ
jgi:hypothetical protein